MGKITWKKSEYATIAEAYAASALWEEKPTEITKVPLGDGSTYGLKFNTEEGILFVQKFHSATDLPLGGVKESAAPVATLITAKQRRQLRKRSRPQRVKKPAKVYLTPNPPLEQFKPGPERKVGQWRYEQVRWTMEEWKEFYEKKFKQPCEIYEVMLVRYPNDNREIEYYKTPEGHIVSRTIFDPFNF